MINKKILESVSQTIISEFGNKIGLCFPIAVRAKQLLESQGIETTIIKGYAAFRCGYNQLANISYIHPKDMPKDKEQIANPGVEGKFHFWLEDSNGMILDFTTYTLREAIHSLDRLEGEKKLTGVTWKDKYLYTKKRDCSSLNAVLNSKTDRHYFYNKQQVWYVLDEN